MMKFLAVLLFLLSGIAHAESQQSYVPGLGEIMGSVQMRHAKLWFAAKGENWPLAAYELGELKEGFEDAVKYQPDFKGKPIAEMIGPATQMPLSELAKAIAEKNEAHFVKAYDQLSAACSSCHRSAGRGFIVIQRPSAPPYTDQRYDVRP
jgi:hypothetical protein